MLEILATIGALAAFVAALTQVVKVQLGLKGRVVFVTSLLIGTALGCLFALGGLLEFRALQEFPGVLSGGVLGLLSGLGASGGKDFLTGIGRNNARARAEYEAQYRQAECEAAPLPAPLPAPVIPATPAEMWQEVPLDTYAAADPSALRPLAQEERP